MCKKCGYNDFRENELIMKITDVGSDYEVQLSHVYFPLSCDIGTYPKAKFPSKDAAMEAAINEDYFECACADFLKICDIFDVITTDNCNCIVR